MTETAELWLTRTIGHTTTSVMANENISLHDRQTDGDCRVGGDPVRGVPPRFLRGTRRPLRFGITAIIARLSGGPSAYRQFLWVGATGTLLLAFLAATWINHQMSGDFVSRPAVDWRITVTSEAVPINQSTRANPDPASSSADENSVDTPLDTRNSNDGNQILP
jgi:hypothetical protein